MPRGRLRVYLGAAPGVGKTLRGCSARAAGRSERGRDVVVGFVETHGRVQTAALLDDLEILPARSCEYRGGEFTELDVDAVLARAPKVVLVDELAHTDTCRAPATPSAGRTSRRSWTPAST